MYYNKYIKYKIKYMKLINNIQIGGNDIIYFYVKPFFIMSEKKLQTGYLYNCCAIFFTIDSVNYGCHCISTHDAEECFMEKHDDGKISTPIVIFMFVSAMSPSVSFKDYCSKNNIIIYKNYVQVKPNDLITFDNSKYEISKGEYPYIRINETEYEKCDNFVGEDGKIYTKTEAGEFIVKND